MLFVRPAVGAGSGTRAVAVEDGRAVTSSRAFNCNVLIVKSCSFVMRMAGNGEARGVVCDFVSDEKGGGWRRRREKGIVSVPFRRKAGQNLNLTKDSFS